MNAETLTGTIDRLVYYNEQNGYAVFLLQRDDRSAIATKEDATTVVGTLPAIHAGEYITVQGSWITHPKFGKQFQAQSFTIHQPKSIVGLKKYLSSGIVKGIGPKYAEKLVNHFGTTILEIIDTRPERLVEVQGIGPKRIEKIVSAWQDQKEISHIMVFLQEKGVSSAYAIKIYKHYKQRAIDIITENPYKLADDIWGIGFRTADTIAQKIGIARDCITRITAGILFALKTIIGQGHLYGEINTLKKTTIDLLELSSDASNQKQKNQGLENQGSQNPLGSNEPISLEGIINQALVTLRQQERIVFIEHQEKHYVTLTYHYLAEKNIASLIHSLMTHESMIPLSHEALLAVHQQLRIPTGRIELNDEQQRGILTSLENKVTIITGGPGTGKTTLIRALLSILDVHKISFQLAAPTGRAAKRMQESTGRFAQTIHRLLEFDPKSMKFLRNRENALSSKFLIVDEASMLDVSLSCALLKAVPLGAHLLFIGDADQLPSVGAGNVLGDVITSKKVPCVRLKTIFRQGHQSLIVTNAHRINQGEFPLTGSSRESLGEGPKERIPDFLFIREEDPEKLPEHCARIVQKYLPRMYISAEDLTVLTPMNRGTAGTYTINQAMQQLLNPNIITNTAHKLFPTLSYGGNVFQQHDRVMQLRNNYDKHVFNGDIGIVEHIDLDEQILRARFHNQVVEYEKNELDELVLAYAITIHKSQGSEYQAIIVPLFTQHFMLLQRNLVYTAITRAKKLCIFIGQPKALAIAIRNNKTNKRITFLREYLTSELG